MTRTETELENLRSCTVELIERTFGDRAWSVTSRTWYVDAIGSKLHRAGMMFREATSEGLLLAVELVVEEGTLQMVLE